MDRRTFLQIGSSLLAGLALDPERALWLPGQKKIFIPPAKPIEIYDTIDYAKLNWMFNRSVWIGDAGMERYPNLGAAIKAEPQWLQERVNKYAHDVRSRLANNPGPLKIRGNW